MDKHELFGVKINAITISETLELIDKRLSLRQFTQHAVINVAKVVNMQSDIKLRDSVINCDVINVDGMGCVWGGRLLGFDIPERVTGIDLFLCLIALSEQKNYPVFLLGSSTEVVMEVVCKLEDKHPQLKIVGHHHGFFWNDEEAVVKKIRESGARLLFVAITSPKKENFINKWKDDLGVDFVMGVGGTFDVVAGKVKRAPVWMQKSGMEWVYRIIQEPRRMWRRYLITNSKYIWLLIKEKINIK